MGRSTRWVVMLALAALLGIGCSDSAGGNGGPRDDGGNGGSGGIGDSCESSGQCSGSLVCAGDRTCAQAGSPGTGAEGEACSGNIDCLADLLCGDAATCTRYGSAELGDPCTGIGSCSKGLACAASGTCAEPGGSGSKLAGEACEGADDCSLGLACLGGNCLRLTPWAGIACAESDDGPARAYFEVPRGEPAQEFYRLPFPNDIRVRDGRVQVSDHPNPSTAIPAEYGDVISAYLAQIESDVGGFALVPSVFMRFSAELDFETVELDNTSGTVQLFDIDPESERYGEGPVGGWGMTWNPARGKYICQNWISVKPWAHNPLLPNTTYAVLLRAGIKSKAGETLAADADFAAMLAAEQPQDEHLAAAWQAYAPLRAYLTDKGIDTSSVIGAAVFTTRDPHARLSKLRAAVHAQDAPALQNATLCDGRATSPCDSGDGSTQACPESAAEAFHEIQAQYDTPVFQRGTAPYLTAADGGDIVYDATGAPTVQRTDKVCVALSVPKGAEATMPANGWPVVIFAHGTGGGYRSFIDNGMAAALAHVTDSEGATLGRFVVVGIDGSMHGPRRGSDDDPDELFFNLRNPKSVRDNVYQGAADKFQLVRLVKGLEIAQEVAGTAIKLDPDQIYFFGHSQGTVEGGPFLSYESDVKGAVMSGAGGYLIDSLLNKTRPQNIRGAVQFALADGRIGGNHPLLNLLQLYFDEVDTLHYGLSWAHTPVEGQPRKHLLLGFGAEDGFTPAQTIEHLARVSRVTQVQRCGDGTCGGSENCTSCAEDCPADACEPRRDALPHATAPLQGNLDRGGTRTTSGLLRYASHDGSYDDHFVLFRHPQAKQQMLHFLATAQQGGAPTIPAPTEE